jgi:hypothetical protein
MLKLTRNPKIVIGAAIQCTDFVFMLAVWGTIEHVPSLISAVHLACVFAAGTLIILGVREDEKKRKMEALNSQLNSSEPR